MFKQNFKKIIYKLMLFKFDNNKIRKINLYFIKKYY